MLAAVVRHEAGGLNYGAQNRNWDGAGLSYGVLQWTQISGNLGKLLAAMVRADQANFLRIFGEHASELLRVTAPGGVLALTTPKIGSITTTPVITRSSELGP